MKYDKAIDIRIDEITALTVKVMELIYKQAYNEAIEDIEKYYKEQELWSPDLSKLKK